MAYYLVQFIEDEEDFREDQLKKDLMERYPTMNGCGQLKGVKQLTFNDTQMSMIDEQKLEWLFANMEDITLEQLENLIKTQ